MSTSHSNWNNWCFFNEKNFFSPESLPSSAPINSCEPSLVRLPSPTPPLKTPKIAWEGKRGCVELLLLLAVPGRPRPGWTRPCAASRGSFGQVRWALASPSAVWCLPSRGWDDGGQSLGPSLTHVFQKLLVFGAYTRVISKPEYLGGSDGPGGVYYYLSVLGERALHFAPRDADDQGRIYCEPGSLMWPPSTTCVSPDLGLTLCHGLSAGWWRAEAQGSAMSTLCARLSPW